LVSWRSGDVAVNGRGEYDEAIPAEATAVDNSSKRQMRPRRSAILAVLSTRASYGLVIATAVATITMVRSRLYDRTSTKANDITN